MKLHRLVLVLVLVSSLAGCSTTTDTTTTTTPNPGLLSVEKTESAPANATVIDYESDRVNDSSVLRSAFEDAKNESAPIAVELDGTERQRLEDDFEDAPYYDENTTMGYFVEYQSDVFRVRILMES